MSSEGTCCGCFNYRQGSVVSIGIGLTFGLTIVFLFTFLSFDPVSLTQQFIREKILGQSSVAMFIFNSMIPISCLGALLNASFNSGAGTRLIGLMIFICGMVWIIYGATLARKLNSGYTEFTASGFFLKKYGKNPNNKRALAAGIGSAVFLDKAVANLVLQFAPYPLNYFYWMGMFPYVPFCLFGVLPAIFSFFAIGPIMSLASVMDAGGDGTEFVEARKIHWFYSLSPEDRERVREGSDLEGESDEPEESDYSEDEESGLTKGNKGSRAIAVAIS